MPDKNMHSTMLMPLAPEQFDFDAYESYVKSLDERVEKFVNSESGVLVHRRFRVEEVYRYGCRNKERSLQLQLATLKERMNYAEDIPGFLEPWYGIGIGGAAFGASYIWKEGQAPIVSHPFENLEEALEYSPVPIENTAIGKEQLALIEYFLEKTKGRLPMSLSDVQAPIDIIGELMPIQEMFMGMIDDPDQYSELSSRAAVAMRDFLLKQKNLIGDALVYPGHLFASSRKLSGLVAASDSSIMISNKLFEEVEMLHMAAMCEPFGGVAYHSCGNWARKISSVLKTPNIVSVDGAFSIHTDPAPNDPEPFADALTGTGVILNARINGNVDTVENAVKKLWRPGMKLIVCTNCSTPEKQQEAYDRIHDICK